MDSSHQNNQKIHSSNSLNQTHHQVVLVVVPFPAQGHLNQLLHLSRLILSNNKNNNNIIHVHYVATSTQNRQATTRVQGWDPNSSTSNNNKNNTITFHHFNVPPFPSPPPNPNNPQTKFPSHLLPSFEASSHLRNPIASLLQSLSSLAKRVIVIHDSLMASVVQDAKKFQNVENYTFHSTCAFTSFSFLWEEMGKPPLEKSLFPQLPSLDGCLPQQFRDFISSQAQFLKFSDGGIYNTTRAIENPYLELIEKITGSNKHYALGPFNPLTIEKKNDSKGRHSCMEWLDKQEANSVMYVSFGTTTTFTEEEIEQIAIGLEQSKKKFIWVLRDADKGDIFDDNEVKRYKLPNGYEERNEGVGLVVRDWAPQLEILSHPSTGGFMSHCGWNSCMESLSMGVPIAAWPMHSDQPRNTVLIAEIFKVGLVIKDWSQRDELMTASDIEKVMRKLMETKEGDEMRERAMKIKNDIHRSMDEGDISRMQMDSFIAHITR